MGKVSATDTSGSKKTLFSETGNKGNRWHSKSIDLSSLAGGNSMQLNFEAVRGSNWGGDISIDNVKLFIPVATTTLAPPTTMPGTTVAPPNLDKKLDGLMNKVDSLLKLSLKQDKCMFWNSEKDSGGIALCIVIQ